MDAVPETGHAQQFPVFSFDEVRDLGLSEKQPGQGSGAACLFVAFLQPFVEALGDDYAALLVLHRCPHAFVFKEGVVATVDGL